MTDAAVRASYTAWRELSHSCRTLAIVRADAPRSSTVTWIKKYATSGYKTQVSKRDQWDVAKQCRSHLRCSGPELPDCNCRAMQSTRRCSAWYKPGATHKLCLARPSHKPRSGQRAGPDADKRHDVSPATCRHRPAARRWNRRSPRRTLLRLPYRPCRPSRGSCCCPR